MASSAYLAWVATETWAETRFVGPSYVSWETSLFKNIKITERVKMEFRAEAFNVLNHTNFQLPGARTQPTTGRTLAALVRRAAPSIRATCSSV